MKLFMRRWFLLICLCLITPALLIADPFSEKKVDPTKSVSGLDSSAAVVESSDTAKDKSEFPAAGTVVVDSSLRLREYPWGPVMGLFGGGTKITVIGAEGDFYKVQVNGQTGYMHKNFVSIPGAPAINKDPEYPGDTRSGGYIAKGGDKAVASGNSGTLPRKASVIGQAQGDGTPAGALTWAHDQLPGASCKGINSNNGKRSTDPNAWNGWCLAFVNTAYGRKVPHLAAPSAIQSYYNFKNAGKIKNDRNPPAGAVMFTNKTSTNPYGHIFIATGEKAANGEPMVISTSRSNIKKFTLSQMVGGLQYLGWAMP